ncbi:hypothetical protein K443DRAFT_7741 [Laccaria amethystina LaAM-08-1]|uniref:Uncharacterized protein n=1 Tax=Laccaria amethystina LaAM-08-1 TaxID=1095629 RepID=A0A0C9WQ62_9AGAR|nr:hypothetical protein K443DRAFT_7741 [Laccaria amethystina LaAM-08-1]
MSTSTTWQGATRLRNTRDTNYAHRQIVVVVVVKTDDSSPGHVISPRPRMTPTNYNDTEARPRHNDSMTAPTRQDNNPMTQLQQTRP